MCSFIGSRIGFHKSGNIHCTLFPLDTLYKHTFTVCIYNFDVEELRVNLILGVDAPFPRSWAWS